MVKNLQPYSVQPSKIITQPPPHLKDNMNVVLMFLVHELKVLMTTLLQLLTLFMFCQVSPTKEESGVVQWSTSFSSALMVDDIANVHCQYTRYYSLW